MAQMLENTGAVALQFTPAELAELNSAVPAIKAVRPYGNPQGKLRISHISGVPLPARRRTGLNTHAYMSCVDNRMRVGRFNLKRAAR
jgi:hypothetical protein